MKDILSGSKTTEPEKEGIVNIRQEVKQNVYIKSQFIKRGQSLWKLKDWVVSKVEDSDYEEVEIATHNKQTMFRKKLVIDPDAYYITALNKENAKRKFQQQLNIDL